MIVGIFSSNLFI